MDGNLINRGMVAPLKAFACPNCGGQVEVRAPGHSLSCVCRHCSSVIDTSDKNYQVVDTVSRSLESLRKLGIACRIEPGTRGVLQGIEWEVIGFCVRQADPHPYFWSEYLLFNPIHGFRFLMDAYGHWNLVRMMVRRPGLDSGEQTANYDGQQYKRFTAGKAKVVFVLGEFYWKVREGETVNVLDLVSPPYVLSREGTQEEVVWSQGEYLTQETVAAAFGLKERLPGPVGVAPNQPNPHAPVWKTIRRAYFLFALIATAIWIGGIALAPAKRLAEQSFTIVGRDSTLLLSGIDVSEGVQNLDISLDSDVDNNWVEAEGLLVNEEDNSSYGFVLGAEYYHGVEDGESWSEGSRDTDVLINSIEGGKYEVALDAQAGSYPVSFTVKVRRGVAVFSNFLILMIVLSLYPLWMYIRYRGFENSRWAESDSAQEDDE